VTARILERHKRGGKVMRKVSAAAWAMVFAGIFFFAGNDLFAGNDPERWTSLTEDVSINQKNVAYPSAHIVRLWVRVAPEKGSDLYWETQKHLMDKGKKYQAGAYEYTGFLSEFDCSTKTHRELMTLHYDNNKNIIDWANHSAPPWDRTLPESRFALVQKAVCTQNEHFAANLHSLNNGEAPYR
jgi:hypothetical protein